MNSADLLPQRPFSTKRQSNFRPNSTVGLSNTVRQIEKDVQNLKASNRMSGINDMVVPTLRSSRKPLDSELLAFERLTKEQADIDRARQERRRYASLVKQKQELKVKHDFVNQQKQEMEDHIEKQERCSDYLREENRKLNIRVKKLKMTADDLNERLGAKDSNINDLAEKNESLNNVNERLRERVEAAEKFADTLRTNCTSKSEKYNLIAEAATERETEWRKRAEDFQNTAQEAQRSLDSTTIKLEDEKRRSEEYLKDSEDLRKQVNSLTNQLEESRNEFNESQKRILELVERAAIASITEDRAAHLDDEVQQLRNNLTAAERRESDEKFARVRAKDELERANLEIRRHIKEAKEFGRLQESLLSDLKACENREEKLRNGKEELLNELSSLKSNYGPAVMDKMHEDIENWRTRSVDAEKQLTRVTTEGDSLRREVDRLRDIEAEHQSRISDLLTQVSDLRTLVGELDESKARTSILENKMEEFKNNEEQYERSLHEHQDIIRELRQELRSFAALDTMMGGATICVPELRSLLPEVYRAANSLEIELKEERSAVRSSLQELQSVKQNSGDSIDSLMTQKSNLEVENRELRADKSSVEAHCMKLRDENKTMADQISTLRDKIAILERELHGTRSDYAHEKKVYESELEEVKERDLMEVKAAADEIESQRNLNEELADSLTRVREENNRLLRELHDSNESLKEFKSRSQMLETQRDSLITEMDEVKQQLDISRRRENEAWADNERLREVNFRRETDAEYKARQASMDAMRAERQLLSASRHADQTRRTNTDLSSQLQRLRSQVGMMRETRRNVTTRGNTERSTATNRHTSTTAPPSPNRRTHYETTRRERNSGSSNSTTNSANNMYTTTATTRRYDNDIVAHPPSTNLRSRVMKETLGNTRLGRTRISSPSKLVRVMSSGSIVIENSEQ